MPASQFKNIHDDLLRFADVCVGQLQAYACEAESHPPTLVQFTEWGKRIDEIQMPLGWMKLEAAAAQNKIVATGYDPKHGEVARLYQAALLYLFHPHSAFVSCPLAMTDGAAKALAVYGTEEQKKQTLPHLLATTPDQFWTSGQWMTETRGGSDVSMTETIAKKVDEANYHLSGIKWFTSATTSQMALTLARIEGSPAGSKGLSMFLVKTRNEKNELNGIRILRLKDKLGTKALPTAELELTNCKASLVGQVGQGVKQITTMINITRLYNSVCAVSHFGHALNLAEDYAQKREVFGRKLSEHPLHLDLIEDLRSQWLSSVSLTFEIARLLGKEENGKAAQTEQSVLRALTPILKIFTAKSCMQGLSEIVEIFGGAGYVEDVGIAKLLRDAQVFPIWEGATHVLCLDFDRALQKECPPDVFLGWMQTELQAIPEFSLTAAFKKVFSGLQEQFKNLGGLSPEQKQVALKPLVFSLANFVGALAYLRAKHQGQKGQPKFSLTALQENLLRRNLKKTGILF